MLLDYQDRAVLVTGGTREIGLATALAFARRGAQVTITHGWGRLDEREVAEHFRAAGVLPPSIVQADATREEDTRAVLRAIAKRHGAPTAIVSNVADASVIRTTTDYVQRDLQRSIEHGAWPIVGLTLLTKEVCGRWPRYVVGVSSAGNDAMQVNYDFAAASKAVLETFVRYLSNRLLAEKVRVNAVRTRFVKTDSLRHFFGDAFEPFVEHVAPDLFVPVDEVAEAIYGMCCGLMDGLSGQIVNVDRGAAFADGFSRFYRDHKNGNFRLPNPTSEGNHEP